MAELLNELIASYPVFSEVLTEYEIFIFKNHLVSTIDISKSAKQYLNYSSMFLLSCNDLEILWHDPQSVRKFIENLYAEDLFVPTVLWSVSSAISTLFVSLKNTLILDTKV